MSPWTMILALFSCFAGSFLGTILAMRLGLTSNDNLRYIPILRGARTFWRRTFEHHVHNHYQNNDAMTRADFKLFETRVFDMLRAFDGAHDGR